MKRDVSVSRHDLYSFRLSALSGVLGCVGRVAPPLVYAASCFVGRLVGFSLP